MNLLADEGIDAPIVSRLREDGHTVLYVAEMAPGMADDEILALAYAQNLLLLTGDKDFGALVFQQRRITSGVLLVRLSGLTGLEKAELVSNVIADHDQELVNAFTVITPQRIRIRPS